MTLVLFPLIKPNSLLIYQVTEPLDRLGVRWDAVSCSGGGGWGRVSRLLYLHRSLLRDQASLASTIERAPQGLRSTGPGPQWPSSSCGGKVTASLPGAPAFRHLPTLDQKPTHGRPTGHCCHTCIRSQDPHGACLSRRLSAVQAGPREAPWACPFR